MSIARYSFILLSELEQYWARKCAQPLTWQHRIKTRVLLVEQSNWRSYTTALRVTKREKDRKCQSQDIHTAVTSTSLRRDCDTETALSSSRTSCCIQTWRLSCPPPPLPRGQTWHSAVFPSTESRSAPTRTSGSQRRMGSETSEEPGSRWGIVGIFVSHTQWHTTTVTHYTVTHYHSDTLPQWHTTTVTHYHSDTLPQWHTTTVRHYHSETLPNVIETCDNLTNFKHRLKTHFSCISD